MQELEKILKEIDISLYNTPPTGREVEGTVELLGRCKEIIRKHMDNDGWIPCSKRLPTKEEYEKDNNEFLVQTDTGERFSCQYDPLADGYDNPFWCCNVPVIAWQPLPEQYHPKNDCSKK